MSDSGEYLNDVYQDPPELAAMRVMNAELLAALKQITDTIDPYSDWNDDGFQAALRRAGLAIKKAEGRA